MQRRLLLGPVQNTRTDLFAINFRRIALGGVGRYGWIYSSKFRQAFATSSFSPQTFALFADKGTTLHQTPTIPVILAKASKEKGRHCIKPSTYKKPRYAHLKTKTATTRCQVAAAFNHCR